MPLFTCATCETIDNSALADYWEQRYINKQKPVCTKCKTNKWHNHFPQRKATIEELMTGDIIYFENSSLASETKKLMIDFITNNGESCLPKNKFEKMDINEVLVIYRHLKGK